MNIEGILSRAHAGLVARPTRLKGTRLRTADPNDSVPFMLSLGPPRLPSSSGGLSEVRHPSATRWGNIWRDNKLSQAINYKA